VTIPNQRHPPPQLQAAAAHGRRCQGPREVGAVSE